MAFVLVPRKPKSPPRQKPSTRPVSPVGRRDTDLRDPRGSSYRGRDAREPPREYDYRSRRPLSPPRRRSSPIRDPRDYRQRRPLSPPRSRRCAVLLMAPGLLSFQTVYCGWVRIVVAACVEKQVTYLHCTHLANLASVTGIIYCTLHSTYQCFGSAALQHASQFCSGAHVMRRHTCFRAYSCLQASIPTWALATLSS